MREILFRGKRTYNGEWVYGCVLPHDKDACTIFRQRPLTGELEGFEVEEGFEVDPETVGQYTGLTDIHDGKIFEGDILSGPDGGISYIVTWHNETSEFICENEEEHAYCTLPTAIYYGGEVIGNIWDNPELLEEMKSEPKDISCEDVW